MIRTSEHGSRARSRSGPRIEWITLFMIVGCYATWAAAGWAYASYPIFALVVMAFAAAFGSSLQHEALHGHPTRNAKLNEALVFLPIGLFYPFRRYKTLHLRHHADERLTDPYDDPETYYRALAEWDMLPRWMKRVLKINNTLLGRVLIGPAIGITGFMIAEARLVRSGGRSLRLAWALHVSGLGPVLLLVNFVFGMPIWLYALVAYASLSILAIRSFCEHQWSEQPDGRTVIIEKSLLGFLFLNNNLHLVHHKRPTAPWYDLPRLYREQADDWKRINGAYVFRNYFEVLVKFGLKAKEPVIHPKSVGIADVR